MKKLFFGFFLITSGMQLMAQDNLGRLLASGIEDTETFATDYLRPGTQATIYNLSNGWFQSAEVKDILKFEFSVIGSSVVNLEDHRSFTMNTSDYQNIEFADGSESKEVATLLGNNETPIDVVLSYNTLLGSGEATVTLPEGLSETGVNMVPSAFMQARLGVFKGTEVKVRYFPKINYDNVEAEIYGGGLQHEFTSWISSVDLPIAVSGLVAYTKMKGAYDFTELGYMEGENQRVKTDIDSWLFSGIVSTNLPVINFYGGLGYVKGSSNTAMLGTYIVKDDVGRTIAEVEDPFVINDAIDGMKANLGLSLKLGFFKLHADYSFQKYEAVSLGIHLGL